MGQISLLGGECVKQGQISLSGRECDPMFTVRNQNNKFVILQSFFDNMYISAMFSKEFFCSGCHEK